MEIWRDIEGYKGLYQISNLGRVKSLGKYVNCNGGLYFRKEKILKGRKQKNDYLLVDLSKDGKRKTLTIHRLVATAFLPNPNNLPEVNHKNENPTDNRVDNLEWCNREYNCNYGNRNEKIAKTLSIPILQFTKDSELVRKWDSARDVERELGYSPTHISSCCKGKLKLAYGFKWCYHYKSIWEKKHIPLIKQKRRVA